MPEDIFSGYPAHVPAAAGRGRLTRGKTNYYSNSSKMGNIGDKTKDKEKEQGGMAKEQAERESREKRLAARAISQSLKDNDGLSAAAVAGATAPASMCRSKAQGSKSKDTQSVGSPPRKFA